MSGTRQLGLTMCTALVVGNTIGISIFMQPAALAPFRLNALIGWMAVIAGCVCIAITLATLARHLPEADGPFGYVRETLGEAVAFPVLWCYWISVWVTNAVLAIGTVGYFVVVFPAAGAVDPAVLAVGFMWLFVCINLLGVRSGGRVQVVTTVLKLVPLILVIVLGSASILADPAGAASRLPTTPLSLQASMAAASIALFTMLGFEAGTIAAGRTKDPGRTIPRATLIGTLVVAGTYIAIVAIGMMIVPQATLAASDAPFVTILDSLLGPGQGRWLSLFIVISALGSLNGWTLLAGELTRTLAVHKLVPSILGQSNRFDAPWASLLLIGALAAVVGLMNYSESLVGAFIKLSLIVSAASLPLYVCCSLGLFTLLRRKTARPGLALWLAGAGSLGFAVFAFFGVGWEPFLWALLLSGAGLPIYYAVRRWEVAAAATQTLAGRPVR